MTNMIDLSRIVDDTKCGVICETEGELRMFVDAIKSQRKDIDIGSFKNSDRKMSESYYHGKAYFLNFKNTKYLQYGNPKSLPEGLYAIPISDLLSVQDLPDINADQTQALSMLGL